MWIDSHCHLTHERIKDLGTPEQLIREAMGQGIDGLLTISCQITGDFPAQLKIAQTHENVWCSIGTHPHDSGQVDEIAITEQQLIKMANSDPNIVAIGESGLDYFYDNSPVEDQQAAFRKHIRACIETNLPLIVHTRDADKDTIRILKEEGAGTKLKGQIHCFSSGEYLAEEALALGFYLSFTGIVTFKSATEIQAVAKSAPLDRILVETDSPFLAPIPHRGKTNHPKYVAHTGEFIAELRGINTEKIAQATTENFYKLFDKAKAPDKIKP